MSLWIDGGQVKPREVDGVTLMVRVLPAREMVDFLREAETVAPDFSGDSLDTFIGLVERGLTGWAGENAPPFNRGALDQLSVGALQRIIETIVATNTNSDTDRGNSHAS